MSDLKSKLLGHGLQRDEKIDLIFLWLGFYSKMRRAPTLAEWRALWDAHVV